MDTTDTSAPFRARSATLSCDGDDVVAVDHDGRCRLWSILGARVTITHEFAGTTYGLGSARRWPSWIHEVEKRVVLSGDAGVDCWTMDARRIGMVRPVESVWGVAQCGTAILMALQSGTVVCLDAALSQQGTWSTGLVNLSLWRVDDRSVLASSKDTVEWRTREGRLLGRMKADELVNGACVHEGCALVSSWSDELYAADQGWTRTRRVGDGYVCAVTSAGLWVTSLARPEVGELALWQVREGSLVRCGAVELPLEPRGAPRAHVQELPGGLHIFPTQRALTLVGVDDSGGLVEVSHRIVERNIAVVARGPDDARLLVLTEPGELELVDVPSLLVSTE